MELHINPARRLVEFLKVSGAGNRGEPAKTVLMRTLDVEDGDVIAMYRRFTAILSVAQGCVTVAEELRDGDPMVQEESVRGVEKVMAALMRVRFDAPWRECYDRMGPDPILGVSWLVPWYPRSLGTEEGLTAWRESLLEALHKATEVLEGVQLQERDPSWLRVQRSVNRIVEFLNAIEVEGVEAAEQAWVHALALEGATRDVGPGHSWWESFARHAKTVGQVASTLNSVIQLVAMLSGGGGIVGAFQLPLPPADLPLIGSGNSDDSA